MSGSANRWVLRLSTEGADQVIRDLRAAATESAAAGRAYDALIKAQPQLATGAERAEQALRKNTDAMRGMRGELNLLGAATQGVASSMGSFGAALTSPAAAITALGAAASAGVVQIARIGDQYTETMNKLRAATGSLGAAQQVYGELVALSQQTGASISESAGAFVRFSVAARAIGATNGEVLQLTRTIQQAGLISGASTQEAAAGVQQLGQALASGTLQGDELRSILENMPTLAEALARELGVSIGQLRTMGSEGQLTSDRVFQALLRASENINKQFTELTPTMGRAFGILGQSMVEFVGKLDQALGLSQAIARAAGAAAAAVGQVSNGMGPRSAADQADFDVAQARARLARLQTEAASLAGEPGFYAAPRRGTISRAMQEAAAQTRPREERIAELRQRIEAENRIIEEGLARRNQAHVEADVIRQAEEATAAARRAAAARATQQTAFTATRHALDKEYRARQEHTRRIAAIDAGLANGNTDAAGASRLRALADAELADALRERGVAARGTVAADEGLAAVSRSVIDIERGRISLMREGEALTQSVRTEAEKYADTLANLNNLLGLGAITQDTYNRAAAAADPAIKAAAEATRRIEQENTRTTDRITDFFGDSFARAFEGTGNGFKGLMESFRKAAISTFASIAAQAIIRPIIAPVVSGFAGGAATGAAGQGGGILGSLSNIYSAASSGYSAFTGAGATGIAGTVNSLGVSSGLFGNGISALAQGPTLSGAALNTTSVSGLFGTGTASAAFGGIGGGFALGSLIGGAVAGDSPARQTNSKIGAGLGAGVGFLVGSPIGGLVGGALGGGAGGLFGPGKGFSGGDALIGVDQGGALTVSGYAGKNFKESEQLLAQAREQVAALNAQMAALGLRFDGGLSGLEYAARIGGGESKNATNLAGALNAETGRFALRSDDARIQGALDRSGGGTIERSLGVAAAASQVAQALDQIGNPTNAFAAGLAVLSAQFDPLIASATALGFGVSELTAEYDKQRAAAHEARAEILTDLDTTMEIRRLRAEGNADRTDEIEISRRYSNEQRGLQAQLKALGLTTAEVTRFTEGLTAAQNAETAARAEAARTIAAQAAAAIAETARASAAQTIIDNFREAQSAYLSAIDAEIVAKQSATQAARANVDALRAAAEGLREYAKGLALDGNLSPLTLQQRLNESRTQYADLAGQTQTGSASERAAAAQRLQESASTRLGLAASYYAPGTAGYVAEYEGVTRSLDDIASRLGVSASVDDLSLRAQEAALSVLREQRDIASQVGQETAKGLEALRQTFIEIALAAGWTVRTGPLQEAAGGGGGGAWPWGWPDPRTDGNFGERASGELLFNGMVTAGENLNTASVNALYRQFLGRDAEAGIAEQWMNGGFRGFDLATALEQSAEFKGRLAEVQGRDASFDQWMNLSVLTDQTKATGSGSPQDYFMANPDVRDAYFASGATNPSEFARSHYENYGKTEGRGGASFGFATGGSFTVGGPGGMDNLTLPNLRLTAGEIVNVTKGNTMAALIAEIKALRADVAMQTTVTAQGSMAVKGAVDGQTEVLVDATMPRAPVPA